MRENMTICMYYNILTLFFQLPMPDDFTCPCRTTFYDNVTMLVCIAGMMTGMIYLFYMKWPESCPMKALVKLSAVIMPVYVIQ